MEGKSCSSETLRRLSVAPSVSFLFGSTHPPNPPYLFAPNRNACPDWLAESVLSAPQSLAVLHVIGSNSSQPFHMLRILGYPRGCDKQAPTINKLRFNAHVAALCHFTGTYPATRLVIIAYFARVAERAMSASNNAGEYPVTPVYTPPSLPDFPSRYVGEMAFFLPHPTQQSSNFILSAQKNVVWRWRSAWLVGLPRLHVLPTEATAFPFVHRSSFMCHQGGKLYCPLHIPHLEHPQKARPNDTCSVLWSLPVRCPQPFHLSAVREKASLG